MRHTTTSDEEQDASRNDGLELNIYLLIPNAKSTHVLCRRSTEGKFVLPWIRPFQASDRSKFWQSHEDEMKQTIEQQLGFRCRILRPIWDNPDEEYDYQVSALVMEVLDSDFRIEPNYHWITADEVGTVEWETLHPVTSYQMLLGSFFSNEQSRSPLPWRNAGWAVPAMRWIQSVLRLEGLDVVQGPRQVRHTDKSFIVAYTVKSRHEDDTERDVYAKATEPSCREAKATATVSKITCNVVPKVLAIDEERNMFIQEGVVKLPREQFSAEVLLCTLADLQVTSENRVAELASQGIEVFDTKWVSAHISEICSHPQLDNFGDEDDRALVAELQDNIPLIREVCAELESGGIPNTIVHGDIHLSNIGLHPKGARDRYNIFDWGLCYISHPFQDIVVPCRTVSALKEIDAEVLERMYFIKWESYGSVSLLRRFASISCVVYWTIDLHRCLLGCEEVDDFDREEQISIVKKSVMALLNVIDDV